VPLTFDGPVSLLTDILQEDLLKQIFKNELLPMMMISNNENAKQHLKI
jgi:hypothetical protein